MPCYLAYFNNVISSFPCIAMSAHAFQVLSKLCRGKYRAKLVYRPQLIEILYGFSMDLSLLKV